ncbi:arylsulfatase [Sphingobacterium lactis]|uniref:Arylsulfatase A n=1 Tax=Sphingobacterium lactis TaxID=797291 RepID=A0A1H5WNP2_9SPHI|nr:arylsulfatase [Sphingobacterium lactis]SEG00627.1 Arylsulfatase A [Sphingobacterium lactis]
MKRLSFVFGLLLLAVYAFGQSKKPNIILILADDLGYGDLSAYGQEKFSTPNIDRIAAKGMLFTDFYAGAPVCAPSRAALLQGQHTGHTYIRGNKEIQPEGQEPLAADVQTFAQLLQQAGYRTGAFGKWGLGMVGTTGDPLNKGFDEFYGYNCQRQSHRYYPTHLWDNDKRIPMQGNDLTNRVVYVPDSIQAKTLTFIHTYKDGPYFLFVPTVLPHAELIVPAGEELAMFAGKFPEKPFKGSDYGPNAGPGYTSQRQPRATFAAMMTLLDIHVGQILDALEEEGVLENTVVIFTSDNGSHLEGGADPDFFKSSGPFRGNKRDVYEGGVRVPMLVQWPASIEAGSKSRHVSAFWDIAPTLLEIAGAKKLDKTDGISFLPALKGKENQRNHDYLYWEFHEQGGKQGIRMGDYKAIRLKAKDNPDAPIAIYHLPTDINEQHNIADKHPELVEKAKKIMTEARTESALFPFQ